MNIRHVHTLRYPLIKYFKADFFICLIVNRAYKLYQTTHHHNPSLLSVSQTLDASGLLIFTQVFWQWCKHPRSTYWAAVVTTTQWCWLLFSMSSVAEVLCFVCVRRAAVSAVRNLCLTLAFLFVIAVMKRVKVSYLLSTYTFFKDIFRLDMEQALSWRPSCRHLRTFFFSHPALTVKEGHG